MNRLQKRLFFNSEVTEKIFEKIAEIDSIKKSWKIVERFHPISQSLIETVIITSAGASNRIEGSILTDEEVEKIYRRLKSDDMFTPEDRDVDGYLKILQIIFDNYQDIKLTESTILQFHQMLMPQFRGNYKNTNNRVEARNKNNELIGVIFEPTPPFLVQKEMSELIDWYLNYPEKKHPLLMIANFIFEFLAIHPFLDGNGRMSRLLTDLLLLQNDYLFVKTASHESIIERRKPEYYLSLRRTQSSWKTPHENLEAWIFFFLEVVKDQSEIYINEC